MADHQPKNHKEWERPIVEVEETVAKLREAARREKDDEKRAVYEAKADRAEDQKERYLRLLYSNLGPWEKTLVARADKRPYTLDYVQALFTDFVELQGDRRGFIDHAIVGGTAKLDGQPVMVLGHQKGRNIQERQLRNFGYARPEGYRKAIRLFEMAERFRLPVVTFIDTPGADAGVEAESRGISEAIAAAIFAMFELTVPSVSVVIGEGGSGGAIGIAASSRVLMLEHSIYSVIAPEGCASILWRAPERGADAARALRLTADSALEYGIIDGIISEPVGGAHRDPLTTFASVKDAVQANLTEISALSPEAIREERYNKFRKMGQFDLLAP
ncbi:acetyl-CoA carboxylase carboxyltransferase subunit alpha [bacterium]|nr:MAG: acetyl-CoA carboxylase carboxyltransferase subunit alpha [bacterium]